MKPLYRLIAVVVMLFACQQSALAQLVISSKGSRADVAAQPLGHDFYVAIPQTYDDQPGKDYKLYIMATANAVVHVQRTGGVDEVFSVNYLKPMTFDIPLSWELTTSGKVEAKGVHVWCDNADLSVCFIAGGPYGVEGSMVFPTYAWGNDYVVASYNSLFDTSHGVDFASEFTLFAEADFTLVTITPSTDIRDASDPSKVLHPAHISFVQQLNRGEAVLYKAVKATDGENFDMTGTEVHSSSPVGVIGASQHPQIPSDAYWGNYICEMIPPERSWGASYYSAPFLGRVGGDTFLVIGSSDNQQIFTYDAVVGKKLYCTLSAKHEHYFRNDIDQATAWTSDKPFLLMQYCNSTNYPDGQTHQGAPAMMFVPPVEGYQRRTILRTPFTIAGPFTNYANIFVNKAAENSTSFGGQNIRAGGTTIVPVDGRYDGFRKSNLTSGLSIVTSDTGAGAVCYGYSGDGTYAWGNTANAFTLNSPDTIAPVIRIQSYACTEAKVTLLDTDIYSSKLATIEIDTSFNVNLLLDSNFRAGVGNATDGIIRVIDTTIEARLDFSVYDEAGNKVKLTAIYSPLRLTFSPSVLSFEGASGDTTIIMYDTLRNTGTASQELHLALIGSDPSFSFASNSDTSFSLIGGAQRLIGIVFKGNMSKIHDATLLVNRDCQMRVVPIANHVLYDFMASPIEFGAHALGELTTRTCTLTNTGNGQLTFDSIWCSSPEFGIDPLTVQNRLPIILRQGGMYPIFITFSPAKAGDDTATAYFRATGGIVRSAKLHGTSAQSYVRISGARSGAMLTVRTSPNPWFRASSSPLVLHVAGVPAAEVSVRLYGLLGQEVAHADSKLDGIGAAELMLGLQGLPVGSYVYRVESGGEISSGHVVVE